MKVYKVNVTEEELRLFSEFLDQKEFEDKNSSPTIIYGGRGNSSVIDYSRGYRYEYEFDPLTEKWIKRKIPTDRSIYAGDQLFNINDPEALKAIDKENKEFMSEEDEGVTEEKIFIPGTPSYTHKEGLSTGLKTALAAGATAALGAGAYGIHRYLKNKKKNKDEAEKKYKTSDKKKKK